jgi:hypothetical protein
MEEREAITQRLLVLEAKLDTHQQHFWAQRMILRTALRLLHERGVLQLPELIAALQSFAAFSQGAFDKPKEPLLQAEIATLQELADALAKSGQ